MANPPEATDSRSANAWRIGEFQLREQEVASQRRGTRLQAFTAVAALAAALAAVYVSVNASRAIDVAQKSVQRQAEESRLGTAVGAIGTGPTAQRVAGLTLLRREATQRLESANESNASKADRRDALSLFRGTLEVLVSYVKSPVRSSSDQAGPPADGTPPAQFAVGEPQLPPDFYYAASDIKFMLSREALFNEVRGDSGELSDVDRELPAMDLAHTSLYGVSWKGVDLSWLSGRYFPQVDLRLAQLSGSKWQGASLGGAYLRCARLQHARFNKSSLSNADLRRANLTNADLRGANLEGANLEGANLDGAKVKGANFRGATIDSGALDKTVDRKGAIGVGEPPQTPPPSEPQIEPECAEAPN